jgi:lipopolysaccharide export system permease protein
LNNILIYDNRSATGNMTTTLAESGYIRLSDDKKFLLLTLYNGDNYQLTRNSNWYTKNGVRHDKFKMQDITIPMDGFAFERSDNSSMIGGSQTKNIVELQHDIDSLDVLANEAISQSYKPLFQDNIFSKDIQVLHLPDSLRKDKTGFRDVALLDSISKLDIRERNKIWSQALTHAHNSRNAFSFDETSAKNALNQLYRSKNDWHRKLSIPFSVLIFFLIGAPLGAIIRKGGLGTPVVISVAFFVFYYIISLNGEKAAKEGTWSSFAGIWLSSFILTPIAVYLMIKATNDSSLLDTEWYYNKYKLIEEKVAPVWLPIKLRLQPLWERAKSVVKRKK